MAVARTQKQPKGTGATAGRRFLVGTNVVLASALVIAITVVAQIIGYKTPLQWDMTSSRINSLSDGTDRLLGTLPSQIKLTSLYFKTDLEEEDQARYRSTADDLIHIYEGANRSKISAEWINPLSDHDKFKKLCAELRLKSAYGDQLGVYEQRIDAYRKDIDGQMRSLVESELRIISEAGGGGMGARQTALTRYEDFLTRQANRLEELRNHVDALLRAESPQFSAVVDELTKQYQSVSKLLKDVATDAKMALEKNPSLPKAEADFLSGAGTRYASLVTVLEGEITAMQGLDPLKIDQLFEQLGPTSNPILVETESEALVVDFASVWPSMNANQGDGRATFRERAFKGEEKLTSAILRLAYKDQSAVIFVRYGGSPLFASLPTAAPGGAPFGEMKRQIEGANFIVREWDLKTSDTPPAIEPAPTRTLFIVLKPTLPAQPNPMQPNQQEPPFGEKHRKAFLNALGQNGRAVFIAGWHQGPFGPLPLPYEYGDYLKQNWGINVDTNTLVFEVGQSQPGKYHVKRQDWFAMRDLEVSDHDIVRGMRTLPMVLPWCAPLDLSAPTPSGVERTVLVTQPKRDGIWGAKDMEKYMEQTKTRDYMTKVEGDPEGPFDLAVAAQKEQAKIVVIHSRDFAFDVIAFRREVVYGPSGLMVRQANPGNVTLLLNSLYWLNDNMEFMNIGRPIDMAVLEVESSDVRFVQVLTIFLLPVLALGCGGVVWWIRRR